MSIPEVNVSFERESYFTVSGEPYRGFGDDRIVFTEHSPAHEPTPERHECGCTKNAKTRPEGEPYRVDQEVVFSAQAGKHSFVMRGDDRTVKFRFEWDDPALIAERKKLVAPFPVRDEKAYAEFSFFDRNLMELSMVKRHCEGNYLNSLVIFGNSFNMNRVMGRRTSGTGTTDAPTTVNLDEIGPDRLWAFYECCGEEYSEILRECEEVVRWRDLNRRAKEIVAAVKPLSKSVNIHVVRELVLSAPGLGANIQAAMEWLSFVLDSVDRSELFRACEAVNRAVRQAQDDRRRRLVAR